MYIVTIENGIAETEIHGDNQKLVSGKIVKGINTIDSFSFSILPSNAGFNRLFDFKTLVKVYNTNTNKYEFYGRVLYSSTEMNESGLITKDVTCESYLGYLCDSQQLYAEEQNWTVMGLLQRIIGTHNEQVEEAKEFAIGMVDMVEGANDNLFFGIERENTWETLKKTLIEKLGGEIRIRVQNGVNYIDYLKKIGEVKTTEIALSKNIKSIVREKNFSEYVTRLIPLGATISDESDERLTIAEVNGGSIYLDDSEGIDFFGVHVAYVEFDDVTDADELLSKARNWFEENNKLSIKYSITALDLSLLGLDIDYFDVGNHHPLKNSLLDIDDTVRIIKKDIDICEEIKSTIEVGENFMTLSELQAEYNKQLMAAIKTVQIIKSDYVVNKQLVDERAYTTSLIEQTASSIKLSVSEEYVKTTTMNDELSRVEQASQSSIEQTANDIRFEVSSQYAKTDAVGAQFANERAYTQSLIEQTSSSIKMEVSGEYVSNTTFGEYKDSAKASLELKVGRDENNHIVSMINAAADQIALRSNRISIDSDYFTLTNDGKVTATGATIDGYITARSLTITEGAKIDGLVANEAKAVNAVYEDPLSSTVKTNTFTGEGVIQEYKVEIDPTRYEGRYQIYRTMFDSSSLVFYSEDTGNGTTRKFIIDSGGITLYDENGSYYTKSWEDLMYKHY